MAEHSTGRDILVIGGSAGAMQPLRAILAALPKDFPAAVFVVMHVSPGSPGLLADILNLWGMLPASNAVDREPIRHGRIYVAPPDHHLLIHRGAVHVARGPRENRFRPAIDPLFRTAARFYGPRVMGLLLSGGLSDGVYGLMLVKNAGGVAIVQNPQDAEIPDLLHNALEHVEADFVAPAVEIAPLLMKLASEPIAQAAATTSSNPGHADEDATESEDMGLPHRPPEGELAPLVCPECGGTLWEARHGTLLRYECHEGHAFTAESLLDGQSEMIEEALWAALRSLDENAELHRRIAARARSSNRLESAKTFEQHAQDAEERANLIRKVLLSGKE
jgi:two-component system chemotaxis response regulator CheB